MNTAVALSTGPDPRCDHRDGLVPRPLSHRTYEQHWCGTWRDCPHCTFAELTPSPALQNYLDEHTRKEDSPS